MNYFKHETAIVDKESIVGDNTKIWHFSHIASSAKIGKNCVLGQNVFIADNVVIGNNVKIQNNVSVYSGTIIEDDVFLGPSCVLTNVSNPRSQINRKSLYEKILIKKGTTVGANATIVCGVTLGYYSFIAAGSVVIKDVADYELIMGTPGKQNGWMSRHGHKLKFVDNIAVCPESKLKYQLKNNKINCIDLSEEQSLPDDLNKSVISYKELKNG